MTLATHICYCAAAGVPDTEISGRCEVFPCLSQDPGTLSHLKNKFYSNINNSNLIYIVSGVKVIHLDLLFILYVSDNCLMSPPCITAVVMDVATGGSLTSYVGAQYENAQHRGLFLDEEMARHMFRQFISTGAGTQQHTKSGL